MRVAKEITASKKIEAAWENFSCLSKQKMIESSALLWIERI